MIAERHLNCTFTGDPVTVPPGEPDFWISTDNMDILARIAARSKGGQQLNIFVCGPKGCGKTTLAREYAARFERPFYEVHCGAFIDTEQWFGKDRLSEGQTWYRKSRFIQAVETPRTVVLLDEINRAHPEVLGAILGLLDWRRSLWNDDLGYDVKVAPGVVFFATINDGDDYFGTNPLDAALRDRFSRTLVLDYPAPPKEALILQNHGLDEERAVQLALFAHRLRNAIHPVPISTRQLIVTAEELLDEVPLRQAVNVTVINALDDLASQKLTLEALQWIEDNPYVETEAVALSARGGHV